MAKKKKPATDIFAEMETEAKKSVTDSQLGELTDLAKEQQQLESAADKKEVQLLYKSLVKRDLSLATVEQAIAMLKQDYQRIRSDRLPVKMKELGFQEFTMIGGGQISIKDDVAVTVLDKEKLKDKLISLGYQDAIKNQVVVQFPMEGRQASRRFVKYLNRYYAKRDTCSFVEKEDIHSQTLKKLMKVFREEGKPYPDSVSVFEYEFAKIA